MRKLCVCHTTRFEIQRAIAADVGNGKVPRVRIILNARPLCGVCSLVGAYDLSTVLRRLYSPRNHWLGRLRLRPLVTSNANRRFRRGLRSLLSALAGKRIAIHLVPLASVRFREA